MPPRWRCHGFPPLLLDLEAVRDDDHVLAVFRRRGHWGAIAKSNYAGLRFREPVYRTLRELAMSYFEHYFNLAGEKTLRGYSRPVNLTRFQRHRLDDGGAGSLGDSQSIFAACHTRPCCARSSVAAWPAWTRASRPPECWGGWIRPMLFT